MMRVHSVQPSPMMLSATRKITSPNRQAPLPAETRSDHSSPRFASLGHASALRFAGPRVINGYPLAISQKQLAQLLKTKTTTFTLDPIDQYEQLQPGDKKALMHLVLAAKIMDNVFLKQDHPKNLAMKAELQRLADQGDAFAQDALTLFNTFNGIQGSDGLSKKPIRLFRNLSLAPGRNVYPADLSPKELVTYLKANPGESAAILNHDTIVIRDGERLKAIPYYQAFENEYRQASEELLKAAESSTHPGFSRYLRLQSQALVSHDPQYTVLADEAWANLDNPPLEFTIGRESYADELTATAASDPELAKILTQRGVEAKPKDFIGGRVGIVNHESTERMSRFSEHLYPISRLMPLLDVENYTQSVDMAKPDDDVRQTLADVDLVYLSGLYRASRPGAILAQNLPNDDKLAAQLKLGKRNVFHRQLRQTVNPERLSRFLNSLVDPAQRDWYDPEAYHLFVIGHELSHSLGPMKTRNGGDKIGSLGDYGDIIEESKADLGAVLVLNYLTQNRLLGFDKPLFNKAMLTWAAGLLPLSKPELSQAHQVMDVMQFNYLMEKGAIHFEKGGKLRINPDRIVEAGRQMLTEVIGIQLDGDPGRAKRFADKYFTWNDQLEYASQVIQSLEPKPLKSFETPLADWLLTKAGQKQNT